MQSLAHELGMPGQAGPLSADLLATYLLPQELHRPQQRAAISCRWCTLEHWQCPGRRVLWFPCWCL